MYKQIAAAFIGALLASSVWAAQPSTPGAKVYFISPKDGDVIKGPVLVRMGLANFGVAPSGVEKNKTGHHHIIIDAPTPALDKAIPTDDNHRHFGGGQTEAELKLAPGKHTLQLVLGDAEHVPHDPPLMSERITITVE